MAFASPARPACFGRNRIMKLHKNNQVGQAGRYSVQTLDGSCRSLPGGRSAVFTGRDKAKRSGVVTVEVALIVPILLLLMFGLIEYGWMFLKSQEITNAARRGARVAVRADATNSDVTAAIAQVMSDADLGDSGYQVTITPADISAAATGDVITVEITLPYGNVSLAGSPIVPTPEDIDATASMAKEGS